MSDPARRQELLQDPEFRKLTSSKTRVSLILTALILVVYYGFIFLVAFSPGTFGKKITTNITMGIPIGIGVIIVSWLLTGVYVRWANVRYDTLVQSVKDKLEKSHGG
jgi:uncharacterized membrane protein (DUF485 family)